MYQRAPEDYVYFTSTGLNLALALLPALEKMQIKGLGAVYYTARNTFDTKDKDIGSSFSTENQISTLAGLRMLQHILTTSTKTSHKNHIRVVKDLISGITSYLRSSYKPALGYFSQGGHFDAKTGKITWAQEPFFATDCQVRLMTFISVS